MTHIYEDNDAVDQLANDDLYEEMLQREQVEALLTAIGGLSDPLLRRILTQIVGLAT